MHQVADFTVIGLDWHDTHGGLPELEWTPPDDADLDSSIILQYKVQVWFDSGPVFIHANVNGHSVAEQTFNVGYAGPMYDILTPKTFFPGVKNRIQFTVAFGEDFEGPSAQAIGRVLLFWRRKV
jgi:hypothetical protein